MRGAAPASSLSPVLLPILILCSAFPVTCWAACLEEPAKIQPVKDPRTGEDFVHKIAIGNWDSAFLITTIAHILMHEGAGLKTELAGPYASSQYVLRAVLGCVDVNCSEVKDFPDAHFEFENWYSELSERRIANHPHQVKQGWIGYDGQEGIYMTKDLADSVWSNEQLPIQFYMSWEHNQRPWKSLFSSPRDIPIGPDEGCQGEAARNLAERNIFCGSDGWWYSPACRNNTDECVPVLLGPAMWLGAEACMLVESHNLPWAITFKPWPDRSILEGNVSAMFYWWRPDWTYKGLGEVERLIFKKHNRADWQAEIYTSDFPDFQLKKTMWTGMEHISPAAVDFFNSFTFTKNDMDAMMAEVYDRVAKGDPDPKATIACEWVLNNTDRWKKWMPAAQCEDGKGRQPRGDCLPCTPGRYAERGICRECISGRFSKEAGSSRCAECDPGHLAVSSESTACDKCPAGTSTEGQRGLAACADCPVGKYSSSGAAECDFCTRGSYANVTGTSRCLLCPGSEITAEIASSSPSACHCPEGMYKALGADAGKCSPCPSGMTCPAGADAAHFPREDAAEGPYPLVRAGYWSSPSDPTSVFVCSSEDFCPGGPPGKCTSELVGRACTTCRVGFTMSSSTCVSCASEKASVVLYAFIPFVVGPMAVVTLYVLNGRGIESWDTWRNLFPCLVFIGLDFYQTVDLLQAGSVLIPAALEHIFPGRSSSERLFSLFRPECVGVAGFERNFIVKAAVPVFVLAIVLYTKLLAFALAKIAKKPAWVMDSNRMFCVFMSTMFTFFSAVAALSLVLFKCVENPNKKRTLAADLSIVCWDSPQWRKMAVLGAVCVLVYCFGFGSLFAKTIFQAPLHDNFADRGYQARWKFLFHRFRPTVWWWALVYLQKNFLLNLGFVVMMSGVSQLYWAITIVILYTAAAVICQPYRARSANLLELTGCLSLVYSASLLVWFTQGGVNDTEHGPTLVATLVLIVMTPPAVALLIVVSTLRRHGLASRKDETVEQHQTFMRALGCYIDLCQTDPGKGYEFFRTIGEWDRWYMMQVAYAVSVELLGQRLSGHHRLVDKSSERQRMMGSIFTDN